MAKPIGPEAEQSTGSTRFLPSRREVVAGAAAALTLGAQSRAASAAVQTEGFFLVFNKQPGVPGNASEYDRIFFVPSDWLELFEVTEIYRSRYPELANAPAGYVNWKQALGRIRNNNAGNNRKKMRVSALYASSIQTGIEEAVPGKEIILPTLPDANQTYLAMSISPPQIDET